MLEEEQVASPARSVPAAGRSSSSSSSSVTAGGGGSLRFEPVRDVGFQFIVSPLFSFFLSSSSSSFRLGVILPSAACQQAPAGRLHCSLVQRGAGGTDRRFSRSLYCFIPPPPLLPCLLFPLLFPFFLLLSLFLPFLFICLSPPLVSSSLFLILHLLPFSVFSSLLAHPLLFLFPFISPFCEISPSPLSANSVSAHHHGHVLCALGQWARPSSATSTCSGPATAT